MSDNLAIDISIEACIKGSELKFINNKINPLNGLVGFRERLRK